MDSSASTTKKLRLTDEPLVVRNVAEEIPLDLLANHIFPFVGSHQYRFVGAVCQNFQTTYLDVFPKKLNLRYHCKH
jgi:hypothetical protein